MRLPARLSLALPIAPSPRSESWCGKPHPTRLRGSVSSSCAPRLATGYGALTRQGTRFRRVRDDGELGETVVFEEDGAGRGVAFVQHSNRYPRIE